MAATARSSDPASVTTMTGSSGRAARSARTTSSPDRSGSSSSVTTHVTPGVASAGSAPDRRPIAVTMASCSTEPMAWRSRAAAAESGSTSSTCSRGCEITRSSTMPPSRAVRHAVAPDP